MMKYTLEPKFHGKKLELTLDVGEMSVGDGTFLGSLVKIHRESSSEPFDDWFKKIYKVNLVNLSGCFQTTSTVGGFYVFLKDYYAAKERYKWYGSTMK